MSRNFLTGLNLNKNELLNARIQNLANNPSSPVAGQIYYNTGDNTLRYWNGTAWLTLAQGGDLSGAISAAIDALTTDDIEEGEDNLYYLSTRARGDAAAILTGATLTNITITGDGEGLTITAENGVAGSTTDDLTEGTTNKYFTDERAQDAIGNNVGDGLTYNDSTGAVSLKYNPSNGAIGLDGSGNVRVEVDGVSIDTSGSASELRVITGEGSPVASKTYADDAADAVQTNLDNHALDTSTHGVAGDIVGTSDSQTLSNKTISGSLLFGSSGSEVSDSSGALEIYASQDLSIVSNSGDIILNSDGGVYVGTATAGNDVVTLNNLDQYIGDATVNGSTGNTVTDRIATAKSEAQSYADGLVQGLNVKDSVRVATSVAGTLATDFDNGSTVGGVTVSTGDRILIKNQATATENGIYIVETSGAPTRAADADPVADELTKGTYVLVTDGTYAATGWIVTDYQTGSTTWTQFSAANEYTAGDGIAITGNSIAIDLDSDSLEITESGLRAHLNTQGGLDNDSGLFINTGTGLTVNGSNQLTFASGYGVQKYSDGNPELTPSSGIVTWTVTHNLGSRDVTVQVYSFDDYTQVEVDVVRTDNNTVTLSWNAATTVTEFAYRVVVVG